MKKQKQIQKQINRTENLEIERRVEFLKKELKKTNLEYYYKVYAILMEIYKLRRKQMKKYTIPMLANEKGIDLTKSQIYYYSRLDRMSRRTRDLVKTGKVNIGTVLFVLRKAKAFQEDERLQDRALSKIMSKELTTADFSHIPSKVLVNRLDKKNIVPLQDKLGVNMIYKLNEVKDFVNANKYNITNNILRKIEREARKIIEATKFDRKSKRGSSK